MRRRVHGLMGLALAIAAGTYVPSRGTDGSWSLISTASAAPKASSGCAFPTTPASTPEQTAWQLFVAANCAANKSQLVWETWIEQLSLYPANGQSAARRGGSTRLHSSPLARAKGVKVALLAPNQECNAMNAPPNNVVPNATVCEEVHLNPSAQTFITTAGYQVRPAQTAAAQKGTNIQFPTPAVEVKVDWIPASDYNPPFTCANPPKGVHVETIGGACYAMAGMHISSKLLTNWLWATFEPQSMQTNPLRCVTFGPCNDPYGSNPATSNGGASGFTNQTPAVAALMKQANLAPEFSNYRLDGAQIAFTNPNGTPTYLGNSIIEGENVGMTKNTASCITCHSVSSIKNDGTDGITQLNNQVGPQYQIPSGWIARDFVWSLGLACPDVPNGGGLQTCTTSKSTPPKKEKK